MLDVQPPISSALNVADEILKTAKRHGKSLTPMQLMKLVYISHGWALAILERDLFRDRIEAWKYGPVIPTLYQATKHFGRNEIPLFMVDEKTKPSVPGDVSAFLEDVYKKYGHLNAIQLSNLTHRPGSPWARVFSPGVMNIEIPDDLIREHYQEKLNERRGSAAAKYRKAK